MKPLLKTNWTNLAVLTFEADKRLLKNYLPHKTELNDWNGSYYMSLVAFQFSNPVIAGIPAPFYRCFEEVNLRFYIRYKNRYGWKNGVVFIREIAPAALIGLAAKWLYRENFTSLPMKHYFARDDNQWQTDYYWKINHEWDHLQLTTDALPEEPAAFSLARFIRDQYWACTKCGRKTKEFAIEHPGWKIYPGRSYDLRLNAATIYGPEFSDYFRQEPVAWFGMDGSVTHVSYPSWL